MSQEDFLGRWEHLKDNVQHLWGNVTHLVQETFQQIRHHEVAPDDINIENYQYESHRMDDLQLTLNKDPGPGVKYDYTENSEFSRGQEKTEAFGLDSFGEEDTFDPDEADDHQDYRNRKQNSDLSDRYYTPGLDTRKNDLH
jgi:hypothetical protein